MTEEKELTDLIRNGDDIAFEIIFKKYFKSLHVFAFSILNDEATAEDMVQQVFYALWKSKEKISVHTSLSAYLYKAVRNKCLNHIKHRKVVMAYETTAAPLQTRNEISGDNSRGIEMKELREAINNAINSLPEQRRIVFQMVRFDNLKYAETASQLDISVKTVESHMGKALKQLRTLLAEYLPIWVILFFIR